MLIPTVIDKTIDWERAYDIYSRLLEDRIIFIWDTITQSLANTIIAQLLFLDKQDQKAPIHVYINSYGWEINAWLAIYDIMNLIKAPVYTYCVWVAASMGSILLVAWEKRYALPNSEIMIHQPLGWSSWQAKDIKIAADHILKMWERLYKILAEKTGKNIKEVEKDCDRDNFMFAEEALNYWTKWLIDEVLK